MSWSTRMIHVVPVALMLLCTLGCDEDKGAATAPAKSAAKTPSTTLPTASKSARPAVPKHKPSHACPEGSKGDGTFKNPCVAEGDQRAMEVTWTGKITDKGPSFRVVNKTKLEILYGQVVVYFYDKSGKQLEVPGHGSNAKGRPKQKCSGNIFAGPMKPGEKATLWFSCVNKKHVPEGTKTIEAEMRMVGFTAKEGKRADTYWRNGSLTPNERPKGGVKSAKKPGKK